MIATKFVCRLLFGSSLAVIAPALAFAQAPTAIPEKGDAAGTSEESQSNVLEEIIVTARRSEERLQNTPVAVTAFTAADLSSENLNNISAIQQQTPSLVVQPNPTSSMGSVIGIRGQLQNDQAPNVDQSVGIYVDDVYVGQTYGSLVDNYVDIDRVEVLRGPQGTLYGRNTTGGAFKIYNRLPTDRIEGEVRLGYGNYDRYEISGMVNLPIAEGVALRVVGSHVEDDGYGRNVTLDEPLNDKNLEFFRAALKIDAGPDTSVILRADYQRAETNGFLLNPLLLVYGSSTHIALSVERFGAAGTTPAALNAALAIWNEQIGGDPYETEYAISGGEVSELWGASLDLSHTLGNVTLQAITAYREIDNVAEYDLTPIVTRNHAIQDTRVKQFTQELRASGTAADGRLTFTGGLFYYLLKANDIGTNFLLPALNGPVFTIRTKSETESYAAYGQASYAIAESLRATVGLRYTKDKKTLTANNTLGAACALPPALLTGGVCSLTQDVDASNLSYTLGLDWSPTQDLLLYARTSRGFKGGGIPSRTTADPLSAEPFRPEQVTDYEIGFKSEWLGRKLRLNAAAYYADYTDIQRTVIIPGSAGGPSTTAVRNAAEATIKGVEVEMMAVPVPGLELGGALAYTDAKYQNFTDGLGISHASERFQNQPKWTLSLRAGYTIDLPFGSLRPEMEYFWRSSADLFPSGGAPVALRTEDSFDLVNARIALELNDPALTITVWARNLFDQRYDVARFDTVQSNGVLTTTPGEPRRIGVTLRAAF
jgi:Outer membrane receptor proteins, mostly Fe transport